MIAVLAEYRSADDARRASLAAAGREAPEHEQRRSERGDADELGCECTHGEAS